MADKDLAGMLERVGPLVDHWYLTDLPIGRAAKASALKDSLEALFPGKARVEACFESPSAALAQAMADADPADRIVVFGSFYTVGGVLADGIPRLSAPHLGA